MTGDNKSVAMAEAARLRAEIEASFRHETIGVLLDRCAARTPDTIAIDVFDHGEILERGEETPKDRVRADSADDREAVCPAPIGACAERPAQTHRQGRNRERQLRARTEKRDQRNDDTGRGRRFQPVGLAGVLDRP